MALPRQLVGFALTATSVLFLGGLYLTNNQSTQTPFVQSSQTTLVSPTDTPALSEPSPVEVPVVQATEHPLVVQHRQLATQTYKYARPCRPEIAQRFGQPDRVQSDRHFLYGDEGMPIWRTFDFNDNGCLVGYKLEFHNDSPWTVGQIVPKPFVTGQGPPTLNGWPLARVAQRGVLTNTLPGGIYSRRDGRLRMVFLWTYSTDIILPGERHRATYAIWFSALVSPSVLTRSWDAETTNYVEKTNYSGLENFPIHSYGEWLSSSGLYGWAKHELIP